MLQNRGSSWRYDFLHTEAIRLLERKHQTSLVYGKKLNLIFPLFVLLHFLCTLPILLFFSHVSSQSTFSYFAVDSLQPTIQ